MSDKKRPLDRLIEYARAERHLTDLRQRKHLSYYRLITTCDAFESVDDYRHNSYRNSQSTQKKASLPFPGFEMLGAAEIVSGFENNPELDRTFQLGAPADRNRIGYMTMHSLYVGDRLSASDPTTDTPSEFARRVDLELAYLQTHLKYLQMTFRKVRPRCDIKMRPIVTFNLMPHLLDLETWKHIWSRASDEETKTTLPDGIRTLFDDYIRHLRNVVTPLCRTIRNCGGIPIIEITEGLPLGSGGDSPWRNIVNKIKVAAGRGVVGLAIDDQLSPKTDMIRQIEILTAAADNTFKPVVVKIAHEVVFRLVHDHRGKKPKAEPHVLWPVAFKVLGDFTVVSGSGIRLNRTIFKPDDDFILVFEGGRGDYRIKNGNHKQNYRDAIASVKTYRSGFWPNRVFVQG